MRPDSVGRSRTAVNASEMLYACPDLVHSALMRFLRSANGKQTEASQSSFALYRATEELPGVTNVGGALYVRGSQMPDIVWMKISP